MDRRDPRLVDMWGEDPLRAEEKRPIIAAVLVAVLCVVLMILV
jgi:protein-S-isoprenylcysteine O-methyltransferase Ste14